MSKPTIAILYICTGKYQQFFSTFYESAERYLLKDIANKTYFVFTDNPELSQASNVRLKCRNCQGFPMDSLMRFDMFLSIEEELAAYDYTYFFNANMRFVAPVGEELLAEGLSAVIHPGYAKKPVWRYPYERNPLSTAYVTPHGKDYRYYMGSLNGGQTKHYLQMCHTLSQQIHQDLERGIIAVYHDESHLNRYLREHPCNALPPSYAAIEGKKEKEEPKIILTDKTKLDPYFDKGRKHSPVARLRKGVCIIWQAIKWYTTRR